MIRGLAALAVCIGHLRSFVFVDYSSRPPGHAYEIPFYLLAGLGNQAVMVFFALSGFLVGGPALRRINEKRWNFPDYSVHRFTRLWTALIPALIATALIDYVGRDVMRLAGYGGEYFDLISAGPMPGEGTPLDPLTFLGNVMFLGNVVVPIFGTDGPLWSLTYEFAYYFAVPLAWLALRGGAALTWRVLGAVLTLLVVLVYPWQVTQLSVIWIAGGLAYLLLPRVKALTPRRFALLTGIAVLALLVTLPLTLRGAAPLYNILFGLACAFALPSLARLRNPGGFYGRASFWLSEISFTLYVVHFPFALFLWFALFAPAQYPLGATGLAIWFGLLLAVLAYALGMWWLFERNTGRVRQAVQRLFRTNEAGK